MESSVDFLNETIFDVFDARKPLISDEVYSFIPFITYGIICCIISIIGLFANVINIAIFIKIGFKETVNISLTFLAATDLAFLICLLWMSVCHNTSFIDLVYDIIDLQKVSDLLGGMQRAYFTIVSGCITSVVAFERCICVLKPLHVKFIINRFRLILIIVSIFLLTTLLFIPRFITTRVGWVHVPKRNRTLFTLIIKENSAYMFSISYGFMTAVCILTYVFVSACTAIIVWKLASQRAWREAKLTDNKKGSGTQQQMSGRDKRATVTVTLIASMYIICYSPVAIAILVMSIVPEFNKGTLYKNTYGLVWAIAYISEGICSSSNILVYLKTSTKFKDVFLSLFTTNKDRIRPIDRTSRSISVIDNHK